MKIKDYFFALAFLWLCATTLSAQTHQWSLKECMDYATINSIEILKNRAQTSLAAEEIKQQKAQYLPTLSASTNQSLTYRPFLEGTTSFTNGNAMSSSAKKTSYSDSYGINASWTVYNGNQTSYNIKNAKLEYQQTELQTEENINSIKEQIVQLYINIMYTKEALKVNREILEQDIKLYNRGKELLAQGQIANYELLELQATVAEGKYDTVNTRTQIDNYLLQLRQLLSLPADEPFDVAPISASDEAVLETIPDARSIYNRAQNIRPEIKASELSIAQAELDYKIAKAGYLPTIRLTAGIGDNHSDGSDSDWFEQMKRNLDGSVGLTVSVPIFDNRQNKTNTQKAKINKTIAELDKQDAERTLFNTISTYHLEAINNQQKYIAGVERLNYNQENYDAIMAKAQIGTMDIVETLNARSSFLQAQQDALQSKYLTIYNREMLNFYADNTIEL